MSMHVNVRRMVGKMIAALMVSPCTLQDLVEESGLVDSTVRDWIKAFRATGIVRISGYAPVTVGRRGKTFRYVYSLNPDGLPDAPQPRSRGRPQNGAVRSKRYRLRKRLERRGMPTAHIEQAVAMLCPLSIK